MRPDRLTLSAIVPTLDEAGEVVGCLEGLRRQGIDEILVVDGGSTDGTPGLAAPLADQLLPSDRGLFGQLDEGASVARGDVLLFHYADSRLGSGAVARLREVLADERVVGGAFRLGFDSRRWFYRLVAGGARFRNRCLRFGPFGDQSLFVRRAVYDAIGGFDLARVHADHDLVRRLRRHGEFRIVDRLVITSTRRWEVAGKWRTLRKHLGVTARHVLRRGESRREERETVDELRRIR